MTFFWTVWCWFDITQNLCHFSRGKPAMRQKNLPHHLWSFFGNTPPTTPLSFFGNFLGTELCNALCNLKIWTIVWIQNWHKIWQTNLVSLAALWKSGSPRGFPDFQIWKIRWPRIIKVSPTTIVLLLPTVCSNWHCVRLPFHLSPIIPIPHAFLTLWTGEALK